MATVRASRFEASRHRSDADRVFLKACSTLSPDAWAEDEALLRSMGPGDWARVADLAGRHVVRGLVTRSLKWANGYCAVDPAVLAELEALRGKRLELQMRRRAAADRMAKAFAAENIDFILFKGFALAEEAYGDLSARGFGDCDILVPAEQLAQAQSRLEQLGYSLADGRSIADFRAEGEHGAALKHADGASVDLHWALAHQIPEARNALVWSDAVRPTGPGRLGGLRLSPEMTLIHLAAHFCHHDFQELKPLVDFYVVAVQLADRIRPDRLKDLADSLDLGPMLNLTARVCQRHFRANPAIDRLVTPAGFFPTGLAVALLGRGALLPTERRPLRRWYDAVQRRLLTEKLGATLAWLRPWLLPSRQTLARKFDRPYGWSLYPRYYGLQLLRVVTGSRKMFEDLL